MPQSRGVLADANAFAVMTGAIESLRRMAQEQPHPVWDATHQLILQQAARFNGARLRTRLRRLPDVRRGSWLFLPWSRNLCDCCFFARD
jgi:hypothetical protein